MNIKVYLVMFILLLSQLSFADTIPTSIHGSNIEYAGSIIKVFKYEDYITLKPQLLATDTVNEKGEFKLSFLQRETLLINIPIGIYEAILFAEPGKNYQVVLPPFQPKTKVDILNPFYKAVQVYLGILNSDTLELNYAIAEFNAIYHSYIDREYYSIYKSPKAANVDSVISSIDKKFESYNSVFFKEYREYKYALLKFASYMRDYRYVIREYYHKKPFLYQNPAYMDLFNQLFTNYLDTYGQTSEGERIYSDIAYAKSPKFVKETFSNNMVLLNDTLQEIVLLKGLHDAFYQNSFPLSSMLITLDSVAINTKVPYHKIVANNIKEKVLKARRGYPAPKFELHDGNGVLVKNSDFLSDYVYLNFISRESFTCQQDFDLLKELHKNHNQDFTIVSICIDNDFQETVDYFKKNDYDWVLLSYNNQKSIIDDYNVRVYPTYYLINPEGKLSMSPALSPGENFEWSFYKIMQSKKRNHERNEYPK